MALGLGEADMELGRDAEAIRHYQQSLALDDRNENARRMVERLLAKAFAADS